MGNPWSFRKGDRSAWRARAAEETAFEDSLHQMAKVLTQPKAFPGRGRSSDHLMKALELIGEREGIRFQTGAYSAEQREDRIEEICRVSKVRFRQVNLWGNWSRGPATCLVGFHAESGAPLALVPGPRHRYQVIDPETGNVMELDDRLAENLDPVAYVFFQRLEGTDHILLKTLRLCLQGHSGNITRVLVLGGAAGLVGLFVPLAVQLIFDHVIPDRDFSLLTQVVLGLGFAAAAAFAYRVAQNSIVLRFRGICEHRLQGALWSRIFQLPMQFFRDFSTGEMNARIGVIDEVRDFLADQSLQTSLAAALAGLYLAAMFYFNWVLATAGLLLVGIVLAVNLLCAWAGLPLNRRILTINGQVHEALIQLVNAIAKLRVAGAEKRVFAYWAKRYAASEQLELRVRGIQNIAKVTQFVIPVVGLLAIYAVAVAWFARGGPLSAEAGGVSLGSFLAFQAAFGTFSASMMELAKAMVSSFELLPHWERSKVVLERPPEEGPSKRNPGRLDGEIDLKQVFFRYHRDGPYALYDVSLRVRSGEFIGIVGASGCGKSTLMRVLLGFERPERGQVHFSRQDLQELDLGDVRRQLGVVLQTTAIFGGSIYDNLACGSRPSVEDLEWALIHSTFDEVLKELPMGLDTRLASDGINLSGGQRQRLLLARALVRRPGILLLDEATSALDNRIQAKIMSALAGLRMTRIVVAHRLGTLQNADQVVLMQNGSILDCGSFEELARRSASFQELISLQNL